MWLYSISVLALLAPAAAAQSLPASPASSTEKPGKEETAPKKDATGLILTASSRVRYETVDGRPRPGFAASEDAVLVRTGIALEYGPGPVTIGGELIDARAYDLDARTQIDRNDINAVELPQAYVKLRLEDALGTGRKLAVESGRFLLNIGSGRLVATDEYRNTVNGFTGVRVDVEPGRSSELTLFYTLPQERLPSDAGEVRRNRVEFDRETFDDVFFGAYLSRKKVVAGAALELGYYRLAERDSPARTTAQRHLQTIDLRVQREAKPGAVDFDVEAAGQIGRARPSAVASVATRQVRAGFAHAAVGYSLPGPLKPRVSIFYDYASGDRRGARLGRFDTLFGSRRDDLGPSGTYAGVARENISAPGIRLDTRPSERLETLIDYRAIWLASRHDRFYGVTDASGGSGSFGGHQVEGRVRYWLIPKHLRLESNAAVLMKGRFLKDAPTALTRGKDWVRLFEINLQATL